MYNDIDSEQRKINGIKTIQAIRFRYFILFIYLFQQVATTWEDVKSLRQDMEQAGSASRLPFRIKLLQAAANMQVSKNYTLA